MGEEQREETVVEATYVTTTIQCPSCSRPFLIEVKLGSDGRLRYIKEVSSLTCPPTEDEESK